MCQMCQISLSLKTRLFNEEIQIQVYTLCVCSFQTGMDKTEGDEEEEVG